jgi:(4-O-methyl)-D-glucuronate---lignin esterase
MSSRLITAACAMMYAALIAQTPAPQQPATAGTPQQPAPNPSSLGNDANGNPLRKALKTGHVSNYDESKVAPYTLPDPLVMSDGRRVTDAATWRTTRRPEILRLYQAEIYGRIPANTPKVTWEVTETNPAAKENTALMRHVVGRIGTAADAQRVNMMVYTPSKATEPVPLILLINFGGGPPAEGRPANNTQFNDPPVATDILSRGWGYAMVGYQDIQPDRLNTFNQGVIGQTLASREQTKPDEWGAIGAWAWGLSRIIDHLETDKLVDAKKIAVFGHSRLGKTVLWASALDERIAAVYSSCSGEMGAALARRDWGETVDDMTQNFPYWFAGNFQKYAGRWNDMPVDAHMLIALSAPRPVFITGGTQDQWADPVGEFKAAVAAGPVYKLLGKHDLGTTALPPLDTPLTKGDIGWHYHTGGHAATEADWKAFLDFVGKYF